MVPLARFRGGLRHHLVLLVLVALLPMLLWAAGLTLWSSLQERRVMERDQSETAHALSIAVDQEIRLTIAALDSAALSRRLVTDDIAGFDEIARRLAAIHLEWNNVILFDGFDRQVLNTLRPFGTPLPLLSDPTYLEAAKAVRMVMETGKPAVSNLFYAQIVGADAVLVAVPVRNSAGVLTRVLAATIQPQRLGAVLAAQQLPEGWFAAIVDRTGRMISRVPGNDLEMGQPMPEWFRNSMAAAPAGMVDGVSMAGDKVTASYERSELTGWTVSFGVNRSLFYANLRGSLGVTVGFGALVLGGSLLLALAMARRILDPVQALTAAARPFIQDRKVVASVFGIAELDALHQALDVLTDELAKTQQRFLTFFAAAPVMLFVQDEKGRLIAVNDAWLRTLGYDQDEVLGRCPWEFHTEQSRAYGEAVVWPEFLRRGQMDAVWGEVLTKTGATRDVLISLRADRDGDGRTLRTIGAVQDVTEQRWAEKALARAVEEAVRANDSKTRFLAAASHDLRQPLQALSLYLGVLKTRLNGREEQVMEAVGQCIESLTGLLNDMLDVARLDAGVITPKLADVPVNRLLERVAAAWRIQAEAKGLRLDVVPCHRVVHSDPALMDRVLSNLVANAVRYTEQGHILVGCRSVGPERLRIEVWDTGIGIPADKLSEIFEEFRQLGNPERRRDRGTGLGLAIVQRIADLLGHGVTVRSVAGKGSVFTITLPTVIASSQDAMPVHEGGAETRRILVVDDEIHVRSALELVLGEMGHRVEGAETVAGAVQSTMRHQPELVIADFRLAGGETGIDVIQAVRSHCGEQVPAVVLTGDTDPATIRRIVGAGLHLLHKPIQLEALRAFLRQVA